MQIIKHLDKNLLDLTWSLWTELGVAGVLRNHQNTLILIEELILFTSVISEEDPRLRDEVMDWCTQFHHFVSISRLKSIIKDYEGLIEEPFSEFSSTLNTLAKTNWPVLIPKKPLQLSLSQKSTLRPYASAALLNIRARGIFGTGSRADLITFFLAHPSHDFSIAETTEIGYSKRNLAEILEDFHLSRLFNKFMQGNLQRYRLNKDSPLFQMLKPIPKYTKSWQLTFKVLLSLRKCLRQIENNTKSTQVIEIINCLSNLETILQKLDLSPPTFSNDFPRYIQSFNDWILEWTYTLSQNPKI